MPTLVIDNMPVSLYRRIQHLASARLQTPADTVLEVLELALRSSMLLAEAPSPQEPFTTEEIVAPYSIPRPIGQSVVPVEIADYIPASHDLPNGE